MIITTSGKIIKSITNNSLPAGFPEHLILETKDKLHILHAVSSVSDLRIPPSNFLKKLLGDRLGQYSIRVNNQWRICFRFENGNAYDVEVVDYH